MCNEDDKIQNPKERPVHDEPPEVNIEKGTGEIRQKGNSEPLGWIPTRDQTDPNPPDGGSGVDDSKE
jgi:hypothetical protein